MTKMIRRRTAIATTLAAGALAAPMLARHGWAQSAGASAYPGGKTVRIVVPFAAGGTTDILGRVVAQLLTESMGRHLRGRQQDRGRRQCRRRAGGQGAARRHHPAAGHGRHRRHQPVSLQDHALRQREELRAGGAGRRSGERARRPSELPGQDAQGVRRLLQGAGPQQGELRLAGRRRHRASGDGVSVEPGRHQARACRLSRQLAGHEGPAGRPHPRHHGQPAALPAAHPVGRAARAGRQLGQALVRRARRADHRRAGLSPASTPRPGGTSRRPPARRPRS